VAWCVFVAGWKDAVRAGERVSPCGVTGGPRPTRARRLGYGGVEFASTSTLAMKAPGTISVGLQPGIGQVLPGACSELCRTRWRVAECHRQGATRRRRTLQSALEVLGTNRHGSGTR